MRLDWLPSVLRAAGLDVYELPGWLERQTRDGFDPKGIVWHHTATSAGWLDGHVAALLRDGRRDLSGPLSQVGLERDGTWVLIAGGRANHNGYGLWGNDSIGIEAYNSGLGEPWPQAQLDAYHKGTAAICKRMGWNPITAVMAHRETDPGRKIDPTGIDMNTARKRVSTILRTPVGEDDMNEAQEKKLDRALVLAERCHKALGLSGLDDDDPKVTKGNIVGRVGYLYLHAASDVEGEDIDTAELVDLIRGLPAATVAAIKSAL